MWDSTSNKLVQKCLALEKFWKNTTIQILSYLTRKPNASTRWLIGSCVNNDKPKGLVEQKRLGQNLLRGLVIFSAADEAKLDLWGVENEAFTETVSKSKATLPYSLIIL